MTPTIRRSLGFLFVIAAVVFAILNLHRVANLGMPWLAPILMILGAVLVISARRREV